MLPAKVQGWKRLIGQASDNTIWQDIFGGDLYRLPLSGFADKLPFRNSFVSDFSGRLGVLPMPRQWMAGSNVTLLRLPY